MAGGPTAFISRIAVSLAMAAVLGTLLSFRVSPEGGGLLVPGGLRIPELCVSKLTTGLPCPGCGFGRSVVLAARGQLERSAAFHPAGVLFAGWIWLAASSSALLVAIRRDRRGVVAEGCVLLGTLTIVCLLAVWVSAHRANPAAASPGVPAGRSNGAVGSNAPEAGRGGIVALARVASP